MFTDYFKLAWENISHRKIRSWLTIIGIIIGIMAVVALISLGQGVKKVITDEFTKIGTDKIFVFPAGGFSSGPPGSVTGINPMTEHDIEVIRRSKGVNQVSGLLLKPAKIIYDRNTYFSTVIGIPLDDSKKLLDEAWNFKYAKGRSLKSGDKYKIIVGYDVANDKIFGKNVNVGDKINIEGQDFEIVGEIASMGDPDIDSGILMPQDTATQLFGAMHPLGMEESEIIVRVNQGEDPAIVADNIKKDLRRSRNVKEGEEDFSVQTTGQLLASFGVILNALLAIVIGIAAISLFVGGVGIMNTMYTAVLQRTNEIGVMKAIGAKNSDILQIFMIESGMLGLIGGTIGLILGMGLSSLVALIGRMALKTTLLYAYFPWYLIVGSLLFAFVVGVLSGVLPAIHASKQNPVESLRYE
jgi:putative ABC transport system permease protein